MTAENLKKGWIMVILGGIFQVIWAIGLDYTEGFTKIRLDIFVIIFVFLSIWCLSASMNYGVAFSTAYTVWIGLGVIGTIIVSAVIGLETINLTVALFLAVIIGGIIGLKMTPTEKKPDTEE